MRYLNALAQLVAIGFLLVMVTLLGHTAVSPETRYSIGEPNRWISIPEFVLGALTILWLGYLALREVWVLGRSRS